MMHCTMEDLGALQAGEASVWARRHITTCAACQAELEGLYQRIAQLKALPALRPPRDRWPAVKSALRTQRSRPRRTWGPWTGSPALAATLAAEREPAGPRAPCATAATALRAQRRL